MRRRFALVLLGLTTPLSAQIATPPRPVTDPHSLTSLADPAARPVPIGDLASSRSVLSAAWSADGKRLFLATNLSGRYNIWRVDAGGSWPVQMTTGDDNQSGIAVSPDGGTVYFQQDKGGNEQYDLYAVPADGGAVVNLTNTPDVQESAMLVSPDGKWIALSTKKSGAGQIDVAVMNVATRKVRSLTAEADPQWDWSAVTWVDGGKALITNRAFVGGSASEVWRIDVATGKTAKLLGKADTIYSASDATPDGAKIAITTNEGTGQSHSAVYMGGSLHALKTTPWEQSSGTIAPNGRSLIVSTNVDGRQTQTLTDLTTLAETPLPLPPGVNSAIGAQPFTPDSRQLLIIHSGADTPGELYRLDIASGTVAPITHLAVASLSPEHLPKSRVVTFKSFDGTLISAVVTMPFNLKRDGNNPAVVVPHGGPTGQTTDGFSRTAVAFASRGYIVIQPNPRGSTGYGAAFQHANYRDLGGGDLKDEIAAKDFLVASGYVDSKRVGITGGSYGGFMTLMAIGRTPDAFAAAVEMYGIIDWRTMWAHEDALLQAYQRTLLDSPETAPKVYDAASPLTYIHAVKAPLLVQQGENDIRVPPGQAHQVIDALKAKGNIVDSVFYPDEGHGFYKREHQLDSLQRTIAWFDKYLKAAPGK